jgi:AcrR family transcriptional regulator
MNDQTRGPGRPAGDDRRQVRERLLETALALFTRHGFDGVSMRRLAREAGATPAMIHYYFGDKHGLFRALLEEVLAPRLDELESLAGKRPVTLAEFMGVFISMFAEHPWIPPLVFREVVDGPVDVRRRFAQRMVGRVFPILTGALAAETDAGTVRDDLDPVAVVISVMSLCVYPFLARPMIEAGLGERIDEAFVSRWRTHAVRLLYEGIGR